MCEPEPAAPAHAALPRNPITSHSQATRAPRSYLPHCFAPATATVPHQPTNRSPTSSPRLRHHPGPWWQFKSGGSELSPKNRHQCAIHTSTIHTSAIHIHIRTNRHQCQLVTAPHFPPLPPAESATRHTPPPASPCPRSRARLTAIPAYPISSSDASGKPRGLAIWSRFSEFHPPAPGESPSSLCGACHTSRMLNLPRSLLKTPFCATGAERCSTRPLASSTLAFSSRDESAVQYTITEPGCLATCAARPAYRRSISASGKLAIQSARRCKRPLARRRDAC